MDCKMTDIIAIISSIIAIGYSIYSIITKSYIRQYNLEKFEHFSLNQKKVCIVFNFIMTLIIGISGVYILLLYLYNSRGRCFIPCYYTFFSMFSPILLGT